MAASILLVDDNADIRETIRQILALEGVEVRTAEDGRVALQTLRSGWRPSLVLLDLMMPVMNGVEFLHAARADPELSSLRVVVMTAFPHMAEELKAQGLEIQGLLEKPIEFADLLSVVQTANEARAGG